MNQGNRTIQRPSTPDRTIKRNGDDRPVVKAYGMPRGGIRILAGENRNSGHPQEDDLDVEMVEAFEILNAVLRELTGSAEEK